MIQMKSIICLFLGLLVIEFVEAIPLNCTDHPKCNFWKGKGLCKMPIYDDYFKMTTCPVACGYCKKNTGGNKNNPNENPYIVFKNNMNESANACDDFFQFAYLIFEKDAQSTVGPIQKLYDFQKKCMDVAKIEQADQRTTEFLGDIDTLGGMPMLEGAWPKGGAAFDFQDFIQKIAAFYLKSDETFVGMETSRAPDGSNVLSLLPSSLIMKKVEDYLDPEAAPKRQALLDFLAELVSYLAFDAKSTKGFDAIRTSIEAVIALEIKLAGILKDVPKPDPADILAVLDKRKISDLARIFPRIDFLELFDNSEMYPDEVTGKLKTLDTEIYILNEDIMTKINAELMGATPQLLADYAILRLIVQTAPYLDSRFSQSCNKFAKVIDGGAHVSTRLQDCFDTANRQFGAAVDYLFLEKRFSFEEKTRTDQMFENVRTGMKELINSDKWLSDDTKKAALNKLSKMRKFIGGVPYVTDSSELEKYYNDLEDFETDDSYRKMAIKMTRHARRRNMMQMVIPGYDDFTDPENLRVAIANAMHLPNYNTVLIPAGITYMGGAKLPASNFYGTLGFVIGHELSHGFDSSGANYDEDGKKRNWWDQPTRDEFDTRAKCMENQYSKLDIPDTQLKINGKLTLPENIDNAGIKAAFRAYKHYLANNKDGHVPGYSKYTKEQIFFISAASVFCDWQPIEVRIDQQKNEEHATGFARINTAMKNFPEFAKAFKCKVGSKMNPAKNDKCEVW